MNILLEKDIVSLTDFARQPRKHTAELKKHNRPRVLTHNDKATAVVLSVSAFDTAEQVEAFIRMIEARCTRPQPR